MENVKIDFSLTESLKCKCGNEIFLQVFFIRIIPAIVSPTLRRELAPVPAFQCTKCKTIADMNQKQPEKIQ